MALGVIALLAIVAALALAAMLARQRRQDRACSRLMLDKPSSTAMLGEPAGSHILHSAIAHCCTQQLRTVASTKQFQGAQHDCGAMVAFLKGKRASTTPVPTNVWHSVLVDLSRKKGPELEHDSACLQEEVLGQVRPCWGSRPLPWQTSKLRQGWSPSPAVVQLAGPCRS